MRRIINTFKHGSAAVKLTLLATIICGLATAGLLVCSFVFGHLIWFFATVFAGFITVSLAQTFGIQGGISDDEEIKPKQTESGYNEYVTEFNGNDGGIDDEEFEYEYDEESKGEYEEKNDEGYDEEYDEEYDDEHDEENGGKAGALRGRKNKKTGIRPEKKKKEKKIKEKKTKIKKNKKTKEEKADKKEKKKKESNKKVFVNKKALVNKPKKVAKHGSVPKVAKVSAVDIDYRAMLKMDIKESKKKLAQKEDMAEAEGNVQNTAYSGGGEENDNNKHNRGFVPEPLTVETVKQYNLKKIKKTLHKYKVKRDHKLAMIDRCETYNISQTPAYIWVDGNEFHILLIEQEPRHLVLSTFKVGRIKYLKKQPVNINTDYEAFNAKSLVTDLFRPYLPDYNQSNVDNDLNYYKNLYGIGPGIYFTNNSAKQLISFFGFGMDVDDKVTESKRVNLYFKDAYKANIMVRDNVLDANGYADRISSILEEMAASNLSYNEFKETLNLMIKNKFITKEFGMHYMDVRDKKHG